MLILASQSPRRRELLTNAGFHFIVRPAAVEEFRLHGEQPEAYVERLASEKARAVRCAPGEIVLGADTVVVVDGDVLEKPVDAAGAARMLARLAGREHRVVTGVCLRTSERELTGSESTTVRFVALSHQEIAEYAASGEPMDKAGAYAIQGLASRYINRIEGCYFNVVGLPLARVYRMLGELRENTR